jgi:lipoate-protein ligase A
VIGKGSDPALEVSLENVLRDRIPVLRRATGGCAVVLSPDMLVGSFALRTEEQLPSRECFRLFLQIIMGALRIQGIRDLGHQGISDIAIGERKIAGTAIYRNRQLVFFHAILNVAGGTEAMEKYLLRPPRMPDYRRNRSHHDFVTSLTAQGYSLDSRRFANDVKMEFIRRFGAHTSLASEAA